MRFHLFHKWEAVKVDNYIDTSYGGRAVSFRALFRCVECGNLKSKSFYLGGHATLDQLNGVTNVLEEVKK